jgi:hypothetical protein
LGCTSIQRITPVASTMTTVGAALARCYPRKLNGSTPENHPELWPAPSRFNERMTR